VRYESIKSFATALDSAGWQFLAERGEILAEDFRLQVEECPIHGPGCARVTYGMLRDHVTWARADAMALAATLLQTMLPPRGHTPIAVASRARVDRW
jgi:hypothetical protein